MVLISVVFYILIIIFTVFGNILIPDLVHQFGGSHNVWLKTKCVKNLRNVH